MVGGRSGRVRVFGGFGWPAGLFAVSLAAACGGRTSMLDADAFLEPGENNPSGGKGGSGNIPQGGKGGSINVPTAGTASTPLPTAGTGSGGTGSTPLTPIQKQCQAYCKGYANICPQKFSDTTECIGTCENELGSTDAACQKKGITALRCLTPFFGSKNLSCDMAIGNGLAKCNNQVNAFKVCSGEINEPTPTPDPPDPVPICSSSGDVGPNYCKSTYTCVDGFYTVSCFQSDANANANYDCTCYMPNGTSLPVSLGGFMAPPCNYAATLCGVETVNQ
jgi:hypothetical protein